MAVLVDVCAPRGRTISKGAVVAMTEKHFQHDDDLAMTVLEIIGHYQPIPTTDIWYELGEDDRVEDGVALAEVKEILSHFENTKRIFRGDGDKWVIRKTVDRKRTSPGRDVKESLRRKAVCSQQGS